MCAADSGVTRAVSRLRRDAYTGVDRCWPCTLLNIGLLVIAATVLGRAFGAVVGGAVVLVGVAAIWLRGYLVPYTPQITARLLPLIPGDRFTHPTPPVRPPQHDGGAGRDGGVSRDRDTGHGGDAGHESATDGGTAGIGVVEDLLDAGVLVADGAGLSLDPDFRDAWQDAIETSRVEEPDPDALADALADSIPWVAEASVVTDDGRHWVRLTDEADSIANETWLSVPAAVADLTAVRTLVDRTTLGPRQLTLAAPSLRQFLEQCPACGGPLEVTPPQACCGSPRYVAEGIDALLACPACDELVTTFEGDPDEE